MSWVLYGLVVWLLVVGAFGIVNSRNLLHLTGCMSVVTASTYVLLLAIGYRSGQPPIATPGRPDLRDAADPVLQAMTVTDIVVGLTASAVLVGLAVQAYNHFGTLDPRAMARRSGEGQQ